MRAPPLLGAGVLGAILLGCARPAASPLVLDAGRDAVDAAAVASPRAAPPMDDVSCLALEDQAGAEAMRAKAKCLRELVSALDPLLATPPVSEAVIAAAVRRCTSGFSVRGVAVDELRTSAYSERNPRTRGKVARRDAAAQAACLEAAADAVLAAVGTKDVAAATRARAQARACDPVAASSVRRIFGGPSELGTKLPPWPMGPLETRCTNPMDVGPGWDFAPGVLAADGGRELEVSAGTSPENLGQVTSALDTLLCSRARTIRCCHELAGAPSGESVLSIALTADGSVGRVALDSEPKLGSCIDGRMAGLPLGVAPQGGAVTFIHRTSLPPSVPYPPGDR